MTLISAYIDLFIRGEKSGGIVWIPLNSAGSHLFYYVKHNSVESYFDVVGSIGVSVGAVLYKILNANVI